MHTLQQDVVIKGEVTAAPKKFRVQLDFEEEDFEVINALVAEMRLSTRAELFRSGLRALRWMVQKKRQGCDIVAITPDQRYIEPEFDFLRGIKSVNPKTPQDKPDVKPVTETYA